jgi:hypothetical protein
MVGIHFIKNFPQGFRVHFGLTSSNDAEMGDELCNNLSKFLKPEGTMVLNIE